MKVQSGNREPGADSGAATVVGQPRRTACPNCGSPETDSAECVDHQPVAPDSTTAATNRPVRFDPAFREAVEAGQLTPSQAYSRGRRQAYVRELETRCGLSAKVACAVADNQMTLADARRAQPGDRPSPQRFQGFRWLLGVVVITFVGIAGGLHMMSSDSGEAAVDVKPHADGVQTDDFGRVTRVIGASPQQVLSLFCEEAPDLEVFGVMPSTSAAVPIRIGILRDRTAPDQLLAIAIREDHPTGRWFAGDGRGPLVPGEAPPNATVSGR